MDVNEFVASCLVQQHLDELRAHMAAIRAAERARPPRPALRVSVGTGLIRLGAWLARDAYAAAHRDARAWSPRR